MSIMKSQTLNIINTLDPLKYYLRSEYDDRLDCLILFGSQARGEADFNSDIDLLIVLQDPVNVSEEIKKTSLFTAQFCLEQNLVISRTFLSKLRFENEQSPFLKNIRREGVML